MNEGSSSRVVIIAVVIVAALGGGYWWWRTHQPAPPPPPPPVAAPAPAPAAPPPPSPEPAIANPLPEAPKGKLPALDESDDFMKGQVEGLVGKKGILFFVFGNFIRNTVATVDNLGREHATPIAWPVNTTPGNFETEGSGDDAKVAAKNAARYAPFVRMVSAVDTAKVVRAYRMLYPLFQQAYTELGVGKKYFNDRLVTVIDSMLDAPEMVGPIKVKRIQIPVQGGPPRESTLFAFADPALEARPAGQKILMRMGPDNAAKLKAKLRELRAAIARQ